MMAGANKVIDEFFNLRERCEFYQGIKDHDSSDQCTHEDNNRFSTWCDIQSCPLVKENAHDRGVGE